MTWHGSFDGFISLLKEDANTDITELQQTVESQEDALFAEAKIRIEKLIAESEDKLKRREKEDIERTRWLCELRQRNEILTSQRQEIDNVCQLATDRLIDLYMIDFNRFSILYRTAIVNVMDELSIAKATVYLPINYQKLERIVNDITSLKVVLTGEDAPVKLVDTDRGIEIDLSPDQLVASVKERFEQSIAGVLFE